MSFTLLPITAADDDLRLTRPPWRVTLSPRDVSSYEILLDEGEVLLDPGVLSCWVDGLLPDPPQETIHVD